MKAQEEHEGLVAVRDRLESGRVFVEEQLAKTKVWGGRYIHAQRGTSVPVLVGFALLIRPC